MNQNKPKQAYADAQPWLFWLACGIYAGIMIWLLFLQRIGTAGWTTFGQWLQRSVNCIPGRTIWNYSKAAWRIWHETGSTYMIRYAVINIFGNIGVFLPLGYFLPAIWKRQRTFGYYVLTVASSVLLVETIQLITMLGAFDVDDLLLNVLGAVIGFWVCHRRLAKRTPQAQLMGKSRKK